MIYQKKLIIMTKIKSYDVKLFKVFILRKLRKEWCWSVTANNGRIIGRATETYVNKQDAIYNIQSLGLSLSKFKDD